MDHEPCIYTICFLRRGDEILLLNREKPQWMGMWNGVGGKIKEEESPFAGVMREVWEETGICLREDQVRAKGKVTWTVDWKRRGGMYVFVAQLPDDFSYETPKKTAEGILDWKKLTWICHPDNGGVATNLPFYLPRLFLEKFSYDHHFIYENGKQIHYRAILVSE
jgi:8-oxo-dGTP diphosphatase